MAELTPMMRQYMEEKEKHPDSLLFFRLGDFYEMFGPDARTASRELDLALTTRDKDKSKSDEERIPMCGVPYHSAEGYIARLIAKGYKVSICEQMEDPALAKGLVKREIIRTVTPGTVLDEACLDAGRSNYLCGVYLTDTAAGLCAADISTGQAQVTAFTGAQRLTGLINELGRFAPAEAVMNAAAYDDPALTAALEERFSCRRERLAEGRFDVSDAEKKVRLQFGEAALRDLPRNESAPLLALGGLLTYLYETQKTDVKQLDKLEWYRTGQFMELDLTARRNLELTETMRAGEKRGSLLWVLDHTKTAMGSRMLRSWLEKPLLSPKRINARLDAVEELTKNSIGRDELVHMLQDVSDYERVTARIVTGAANCRDLVSLGNGCEPLPELRAAIGGLHASLFGVLLDELDDLSDLRDEIRNAIVDEPPFSVREGGILKPGYSDQVDHLRNIRDNGAQAVAELEAKERIRTGIKKLKIGYNKVFGYYIDVPKSAGDVKIPDNYIRKQTLVSNERYFTPELKELETTLLTASDKIKQLEYDFFMDLCSTIAEQVAKVQATAEAIAQLDVLCAFAEVAVRNDYCMPEVDASGELIIREGRHPVVEQTLSEIAFVPNDTQLNCDGNRVAIVTGPNMAGKSTYMRQTALITLMAQIGSFVPAKSAVIGVVDRVFTRIGASDDLASGQSTFMLEMSEVANILSHATGQSLLILDEIGRGTSTYDGMAIARAVLEYCADKKKLGAKTMFATHYHELAALEGSVEGVHNYSISAKKQGDSLVFLRKIVPGAADDSYGIEVAKLAGVPDKVVSKAKTYLRQFEAEAASPKAKKPEKDDQISLVDAGTDEVGRILRSTDINSLTPLEALNLLSELQQKARG